MYYQRSEDEKPSLSLGHFSDLYSPESWKPGPLTSGDLCEIPGHPGSGSPEETTGVRVTGQTEQGSPNRGTSQSPVIPLPARHTLHPATVTYTNITQCPGALNILTHEPPTYQVPGCAPQHPCATKRHAPQTPVISQLVFNTKHF